MRYFQIVRELSAAEATFTHKFCGGTQLESLASQNDDFTAGDGVVIGAMFLIIVPYVVWRKPPRIALLRPFGNRRVSKGLRRFARKNLSAWGHVITVADKDLKYPGWFRQQVLLSEIFSPAILLAPLSVLFWPVNHQVKPKVIVKAEGDISRLNKMIRNTFNLNYFSAFSFFDRIRKVSSTDALWKKTVDVLLDNADIIVVDLTVIKPGVLWELERIITRNHYCPVNCRINSAGYN